MIRARIIVAVGIVGLATYAPWWTAGLHPADADEPSVRYPQSGHAHGSSSHHDHEHPPVPAEYADSRIPSGVWTDPKMLDRGHKIFTAKCALCHGANGDGKGPGAANLPLKPADLTDARMVAEMPGGYWVWRVSEGGLVEPFKSKGSAMPGWKGELTVQERWAVIAYAHTLSGHRGPHDATEHPELKATPKLVTGEGTVIALRREKEQIVVEHGPIEGFMGAMTMGYRITPVALLDKLKPGDKVRFTIDTATRAITTIDKVGD